MSEPTDTVLAVSFLSDALDVVFPRRCAGCGDGPWPFCRACRDAIQTLEPPWCSRCGAPGDRPVPTCRDCPPEPLSSARAAFRYDGPAKAAIHRLKFTGWRDVAVALASAIAAVDLPPVDVITWVPLARRRLAERGFDQAKALALGLGRELGIPTDRMLRRLVTIAPQARRLGAERRRAMRGAFSALHPAPPRVLVVDDVLTTGATAAACAEALLEAGARTVHLAAAARSLSSASATRPAALRESADRAYPAMGPRPGLWLPGDHPSVVDASRGRNDPRKATVGRRAWRGLDVSPAPTRVTGSGEGASPGPRVEGDRPRRRVWGQRPGQPGEGLFSRREGGPAREWT